MSGSPMRGVENDQMLFRYLRCLEDDSTGDTGRTNRCMIANALGQCF
jgi:hypothetical protein